MAPSDADSSRWELARRDAAAAALEAWRAIEPLYHGENAVENKKDGPATEADRLADRLIAESLSRKYPRRDYGYLTEETEDTADRLARDRVWVVDPIDGTREFIKRNGNFAIQIALIERRDGGDFAPVAAVVYRPTEGQLFSAVLGQGTVLHRVQPQAKSLPAASEPCRVSGRRSLSTARAVVSNANAGSRLMRLIEGLGLESWRRCGSLGVKVCEIVACHAELYVITAMGMVKEWDVCAPHLILAEAGGRMTDLLGRPLRYNEADFRLRHGMIASNGAIHNRLTEHIRAFFEAEGVRLG